MIVLMPPHTPWLHRWHDYLQQHHHQVWMPNWETLCQRSHHMYMNPWLTHHTFGPFESIEGIYCPLWSLPPALFASMPSQQAIQEVQDLWAYFVAAMAQCPNVLNPATPYHIAHYRYHLTYKWQLLKQCGWAIPTWSINTDHARSPLSVAPLIGDIIDLHCIDAHHIFTHRASQSAYEPPQSFTAPIHQTLAKTHCRLLHLSLRIHPVTHQCIAVDYSKTPDWSRCHLEEPILWTYLTQALHRPPT